MAEERRVIVTYEIKGTGEFAAAAKEFERLKTAQDAMKKSNESRSSIISNMR